MSVIIGEKSQKSIFMHAVISSMFFMLITSSTCCMVKKEILKIRPKIIPIVVNDAINKLKFIILTIKSYFTLIQQPCP